MLLLLLLLLLLLFISDVSETGEDFYSLLGSRSSSSRWHLFIPMMS
jgi:hypothetical protein